MEVIKINKNIVDDENKIKLNVAAYARVSTKSNEQQTSFESQKRYYENKIKDNKEWNYVGIYADEGISGTSSKRRDEFLKMIKDAISGKIDLILTKSISRFARNTVDTLKYVRLLKDINVAIIFEEENINTLDKTGEFLLTVLSSVAQQESENISSHVKKGHTMLLKRGDLLLGAGCYGYRFYNDENKIEIVPEEAKVIQEIFKLFLGGYNLSEIKREMERRQIKTFHSRCNWDTTNIKNILTNEKYRGDLLQRKFVRLNPFETRKKNKGLTDKYLIKNYHEPIISKEDFDKVQQIIKNNYDDKYNHNKTFTCLTGKSKCGFCYWSINAVRSKNTGVFVACRNRKENKRISCPNSKDMHRHKIINVIEKGLMIMKKKLKNNNDKRLSYVKNIIMNANEINEDVISKVVKFVFVGGYDSYNRPNPFMIRILLNSYISLTNFQLKSISIEEIRNYETEVLYEGWVSQKIITYGEPVDEYRRECITKVKLIIEIEKDENCTLV